MVRKQYSGTMPTDLRAPSETLSPTYQRAIDATIGLIADRGVKGTSLRDIGAAAQVNFGNLSSHFGGKDQIIAACFRQVALTSLEHERAFFEQAKGLPADYGATILWNLCEVTNAKHRVQTLVLMELTLVAEGNPVFEEVMAAWFAERTALFHRWGAAIGLPPAACDALHLLTLAEACFYLSCGKSLLYRLVAQASLAEAFAACAGVQPFRGTDGLVQLAHAFYSPTTPPPSDPRRNDTGAGTRTLITEAAADVLIEQGLDGVTTRLVAQKAAISLGLVSYHFPSVTALALAGLNRLCERSIEQLDDPETRNPILERLLGDQRRPMTLPRSSLQAYRGFLQLALTAGRLPAQAGLGSALRAKMGHVVIRAMDVSLPAQGSRTLAASFALITASLFTILPAMTSRTLQLDLPGLLHFLTYGLLGLDRSQHREDVRD